MTTEMLKQSAPEKAVPALLELSGTPVHIHVISALTRTPVAEVRNVLTPLVLAGEVEEVGDDQYQIA